MSSTISSSEDREQTSGLFENVCDEPCMGMPENVRETLGLN